VPPRCGEIENKVARISFKNPVHIVVLHVVNIKQSISCDLTCRSMTGRSVLLNLYYSGDRIKKIEMFWVCARVLDRKCAYKVLVGRPEGKNKLEDLSVDDLIILKWTFKKRDGES